MSNKPLEKIKTKVSFTKNGKRTTRDLTEISDGFYRYDYYKVNFIYDDNTKTHYQVISITYPRSFSIDGICSVCKKEVTLVYLAVHKLNKVRKPEESVITLITRTCHMAMSIGNRGFGDIVSYGKFVFEDLHANFRERNAQRN